MQTFKNVVNFTNLKRQNVLTLFLNFVANDKSKLLNLTGKIISGDMFLDLPNVPNVLIWFLLIMFF